MDIQVLTADTAAAAEWAARRERMDDARTRGHGGRRAPLGRDDGRPRRPRPHRRRPLGRPTSWSRSSARCSTSTRASRPTRTRPLHPQQGPLRRRALRHARPLRLLPADAARHVRPPLSPLNGHPNRTKVPGVETNTGPLGHGFPVAVGCALAAQLHGSTTAHVRRARRRRAAGGQQLGGGHDRRPTTGSQPHRDRRPQPPAAGRPDRGDQAARAAGRQVVALRLGGARVDGHDYAQLLEAFAPLHAPGGPVAVIANTIKGKGVSFMEDRVEWHHKVPERRAGRARR